MGNIIFQKTYLRREQGGTFFFIFEKGGQIIVAVQGTVLYYNNFEE